MRAGGVRLSARPGECIEVAGGKEYVRLRIRTGKIEPELLVAAREEFAAFVAGVKAGEFDDLTEAP